MTAQAKGKGGKCEAGDNRLLEIQYDAIFGLLFSLLLDCDLHEINGLGPL